MPELPEVETVARRLQKTIPGKRIVSLVLGKTDFIDNPEDLQRELPGRTIRAVERYGKFLLLRLSNPVGASSGDQSALLVHLGMTGMLLPVAAAETHAKHTHAVMLLDDSRELRYVDPRRFGRIAYLAGETLHQELLRFGSDPLEAGFAEFEQRMAGRRARVKALLLNQQTLRGVGNIYADESLWRAKIHPAKLASTLTKPQLKLLYKSLQKILNDAIISGGSSISDFLDPEGQPGEYQQHHQAYGREARPCFRCKTEIRKGIVAGRSSFYCPRCQRPPRGWKSGTEKKQQPKSAVKTKKK
jgi:formamidopyrimidine-DNA glycosylase